MANYAQYRITYVDFPVLDSEVQFRFSNNAGGFDIDQIAKTVRSAPDQYSISTIDLDDQALKLQESLFSYGAYFTASTSGATVILTAVSYGSGFFVRPSTGSNITIEKINEVLPDPLFEITAITAQAADVEDRNTYARFNIAVANGATPYNITAPVIKSGQSEPLFFDYLRQPVLPLINLSITDNNSDVATNAMPTIDLFTLDSITVTESSSGATIIANTITTKGTISTTKEYSLDNISWSYGSSFTGILPGSYTMYVRDNLGALRTLGFTVVGVVINKPEPEFFISKANGLRFIPSTTIDCNKVENWDNTLFAELVRTQFTNVEQRYYYQLISDCDILPVQIGTNYDNLTAIVYDCKDNIISTPTISLKKQNILLQDKRDCNFIQSTNGKIVIYFGGGKTYDPVTALENGTYTNPNLQLFPFAKNANLFTISGTSNSNGEYTWLQQYYDVTTGIWGIELDVAYVGDISGVCLTNYNELDWNIWEFNIVGITLTDLNAIYRIEITAQDDDPRYTSLIWESEPIKKISDNYGTVVYDYSHKSNVFNIDFSTGIVFRLRIPGRFIDGKVNEEDESFDTEQGQKIIQKSITKRIIPFESYLIPFYLVEKISLASGMSNLLINLIKFVKGEDKSSDSKITERNPFQIITREYQDNEVLTISEEVGIATQTSTVIGSSTTVAIGDNK